MNIQLLLCPWLLSFFCALLQTVSTHDFPTSVNDDHDVFPPSTYEESSTFYRGAVYEHAPISPAFMLVFLRSSARQIMDKNLHVYAEQTAKAKQQAADIIVFPEYGLTGLAGSISLPCLPPAYGEDIPHPATPLWCPCNSPQPEEGKETLHALSCMAQSNSIFLVANMVDVKQSGSFLLCPTYVQFNTDVVFDRHGCLVARYHKRHLFAVEQLIFSLPPVEHVTFDTDFGRFGVMTCFDIVFEHPAVDLVYSHNVSNVVFPTAWSNVAPYFYATGFHPGWARTLGVNLLVANVHHVSGSMVGSGLYSAEGPLLYTFNLTTAHGTLLASNIPRLDLNRSVISRPSHLQMDTLSMTSLQTDSTPLTSLKLTKEETFTGEVFTGEPITGEVFTGEVFGDEYRMVRLPPGVHSVSVCHEEFCCWVQYNTSSTKGECDDCVSVNDDVFVLGAFSGLHTLQGSYGLEVCLLINCPQAPHHCGQFANSSHTTFSALTLGGTFTTPFVYPELVAEDPTGTLFFGDTDWTYENNMLVQNSSRPLLLATLLGRPYNRDPPTPP